jgi:hypothetical protein
MAPLLEKTLSSDVDAKHREPFGAKASRPMPLARVLVPRLVDARHVLAGQRIAQSFVRLRKRGGNPPYDLPPLPARNFQDG